MTHEPKAAWWKLTPERRLRPWSYVWRSALIWTVLWLAWWSLLGAVRAAFGYPPNGWPTLERPATVAVWIITHAISGFLTGALWAYFMWRASSRPPSAGGSR